MIARLALVGLLQLAAAALQPVSAAPQSASDVRVRLETEMGPIIVAVDTRHAPVTARNFLAYVDQHRFDGTFFYRVVRGDRDPRTGMVQGGISNDMTRMLKPIAHEPTSRTGLRHVDGTLSMARDDPGTATGDFFIVVGPGRYLDASKDDPGYAAFGHVVSGMPLVRRILAQPTSAHGWSKETAHQALVHQIRILRAVRVEAAANPAIRAAARPPARR
jgi:peptidyl-prolyl cis-trans isomerase A (cyclophilin A)